MIHSYVVTKKEKRFIDRTAYLVGILFPIFTVPQVFQLYTTQQAEGLSLLTWTAYFVLGVLYLIYASVDRIKPLIISQSCWIIIDVLMLGGILIYR